MSKPLCRCHGKEMIWKKHAASKDGGYWACAESQKAAKRRYNRSEKGRSAAARHRKTDKHRAAQARYWASDKGRANIRRNQLARTCRKRATRINAIERELNHR